MKLTVVSNSWGMPWKGLKVWPELIADHPLVNAELVNLSQGGAGPGNMNLYNIPVINGIQQAQMVPQDTDVIIDRLSGNAMLAIAIENLTYDLGGQTIELSAEAKAFIASYANRPFQDLLDATVDHAFNVDAPERLRIYRERAPQAKVIMVSDWDLRDAPLAKDRIKAAHVTSKFDWAAEDFAEENNITFVSLATMRLRLVDFLPDQIHTGQLGHNATARAILSELV